VSHRNQGEGERGAAEGDGGEGESANLAVQERKRQGAIDEREEKSRLKKERKELESKWGKEGLGRNRRCQAWGYLNKAMGRYEMPSKEEQENNRLAREAVFEKQCEAARLKFEREEMERVRQRIGDVDPSRQELTWWEIKRLSAPPMGSASAAENAGSTEGSDSDSNSYYSEDTGDIEDAVRRVGEADDATANVL
jgi:hypothetical protein